MSLIKKFQNISHQYELWVKGSKIVLGISGGPDSVCLLDVFTKLAPKYDLRLIVAHVNYGLRGKDSDKDQKLVERYAAQNKLRLIVLKPKIFSGSPASLPRRRAGISQNDREKPSFSGRKLPSENELRDIRYDFFEKVRRKYKFDYIAVGHTLDDQAETFLMRIIRGSGLSGMAAMKHKNGRVIRPLLGITKKEILDYLDKTGRAYRTDKTNKEIPFLRNKVRNELIPLLEKKYNPNIKKILYKSSLTVADDYDLINNLASVYKIGEDLLAKKILKLHPALRKKIILKVIKKKKKNLKDIESAHINEVLKIIKSAKSKRQIVKFQGLKITRKGDKITLSLIK